MLWLSPSLWWTCTRAQVIVGISVPGRPCGSGGFQPSGQRQLAWLSPGAVLGWGTGSGQISVSCRGAHQATSCDTHTHITGHRPWGPTIPEEEVLQVPQSPIILGPGLGSVMLVMEADRASWSLLVARVPLASRVPL